MFHDVPWGLARIARRPRAAPRTDGDQHIGPRLAGPVRCRLQIIEQRTGRGCAEPKRNTFDRHEVHRSRRQLGLESRRGGDVGPESLGRIGVGCAGQQLCQPSGTAIVDETVDRREHSRTACIRSPTPSGSPARPHRRWHRARWPCVGACCTILPGRRCTRPDWVVELPVRDQPARCSRGEGTPPLSGPCWSCFPRDERTCEAAEAGEWRCSGRWWPRPPPGPRARHPQPCLPLR